MEFEHLVLSGGSLKGFYFIGALRHIEQTYGQHAVRDRVTSFVGTSVGSLVCFLLCLGYTSQDIADIFVKMYQQYGDLETEVDDIINIYSELGIDDGRVIIGTMRECLRQQFDQEAMTFAQLQDATGRNLVVCAFDLETRKPVFFDAYTTPEVDIATALHASIAIPIIFKPVEINGKLFVDGSLSEHYPITYFDNKNVPPETIFSIVIDPSLYHPTPPMSILKFAYLILDVILSRANDIDQRIDSRPHVKALYFRNGEEGEEIDTKPLIDPMAARVMPCDTEQIRRWIDYGQVKTRDFFCAYQQNASDRRDNMDRDRTDRADGPDRGVCDLANGPAVS